MRKAANIKFWTDKVVSSDLHLKLKSLEKVADETTRGAQGEALIICGPPGVGKSRLFVNWFDKSKRRFEVIKSGTKLGLVVALDRCARKRLVALLDDVDLFLHDPDMLDVLLTATAPLREGSRVYVNTLKSKTERFCFDHLAIIIITNTDITDLKQFRPSVRAKISALISRCMVVSIKATRDEIFDYTCWLAISEEMLRGAGLTLSETNEVLDFFARHRNRLNDLSPRTLLKMASRRLHHPTIWREMTLAELGEKQEEPYQGVIPRMVLDHRRPDPAPILLGGTDAAAIVLRKPSYDAVAEMHAQGKSVDEIIAAFDNPSMVYGLLEQNGLLGQRGKGPPP